MASKLDGDYSQYPEAIRDVFPYVCGELCEMRQTWEIFHRLFMEDEALTKLLAERLGPLLRVMQMMLQDELLLAISRLTDSARYRDPILSLWSLKTASSPHDPTFQMKVETELSAIEAAAESIKKHRHKRIAHIDLGVASKTLSLPTVPLKAIRELLERMENLVSLFFEKFEQKTMLFELPACDITRVAEITALKAKAYDFFEKNGTIPKFSWREETSA